MTETTDSVDIRQIATRAEAAACFALMHELRPSLASADAFADYWEAQSRVGYRLAAIWPAGGLPQALAGYRVQTNLVHGRHLYVDDLVTASAARGRGGGARLLSWLRREAARDGCAKLLLDTPMANSLAHRFYFRCGLLATALRFSLDTGNG